jgi:hypothetical protein
MPVHWHYLLQVGLTSSRVMMKVYACLDSFKLSVAVLMKTKYVWARVSLGNAMKAKESNFQEARHAHFRNRRHGPLSLQMGSSLAALAHVVQDNIASKLLGICHFATLNGHLSVRT